MSEVAYVLCSCWQTCLKMRFSLTLHHKRVFIALLCSLSLLLHLFPFGWCCSDCLSHNASTTGLPAFEHTDRLISTAARSKRYVPVLLHHHHRADTSGIR